MKFVTTIENRQKLYRMHNIKKNFNIIIEDFKSLYLINHEQYS